MPSTYDVIVVGARCGGSPTAMLLARKGYKVLAVDKSTFPSDMPLSTHWVHQPSIERLDRWGLLPKLLASGCPPIKTYAFSAGLLAVRGAPRPSGSAEFSYAPRRKILDQVLVEGAVDSGVELREGVDAQGLLWDGGRVTGLRARTRAGTTTEEHASIVIGADGMDSKVASWVQAPSYNQQPAKGGGVWAYWSGVPLSGNELFLSAGKATFGLPTNDGLSLISANWSIDMYPTAKAGGEKAYLETIAEISPSFGARLRSGRRESGFLSAAVEGYFRRPFGPGWALVGDAGYQKDPCTASGITDAFRDAEFLSDAIDAGLSGRQPIDEALADYELARNQASMAHYEFTSDLAALAPPLPEMQQLLAACSQDADAASDFFGVIAQTVREEVFFAPENIGRIMQKAAQRV